MSSTYTPVATALAGDLTLPDDGDTIEVADVNNPIAAVADGVKFLTDQTNVLANLAALTAITTPADGLVRHVFGYGLYVFDSDSSASISPFAMAPDDESPGAWIASTAHETTLTRMVPCASVRGVTVSAGGIASVAGTSTNLSFGPVDKTDVQLDGGGLYPTVAFTGATNFYGFEIPIDAFLIDGATLTSAVLYFRPTTGHGGLPDRAPKLAIVRTVRTGYATAPTNLLSTGNGYVQFVTPGTAGAYEVDNTLTFTPNQSAVIDRAQYRYHAILLDEAGTNALAGNAYHGIALSFTIPDARRS